MTPYVCIGLEIWEEVLIDCDKVRVGCKGDKTVPNCVRHGDYSVHFEEEYPQDVGQAPCASVVDARGVNLKEIQLSFGFILSAGLGNGI